jgi:membrane fusion protein
MEAAINRQDQSLAAQSDAALAAARAQLGQLAAQRAGLAAEVSQLRSQIDLQKDLVGSAQKDLERARPVAERGFISKRDMQVREEALLSRKQGLSQLNQQLAAKQSAWAEAERSGAEVGAQARAQSANLAASRAEVAQQAANTVGARSYALSAPIAGRVTALTARVGQPASTQTPLMTIVPRGAVLRAQLSVPSSAIGFVQPGQGVRLAVDAFPYQRFGTVTGKVLTVAASTVNSAGPNGTVVPVYPVTIALDQTALSAYGRPAPLVSGMTLTARIVIGKQSLLQWLFDPLYAVQRR